MAENVVDSMVVNVRLDSKPFKRGQRDIERGIDSISKAAVSMFAIFAGGKGLKSFLSDINQTEQNLYFLSKNLDTNATSLQAWGRAVERTGGTAEGLQSTLAALTRASAEYMTTGQTGAMGVFNQLGIGFGNAEDMLERIRDVLTPIAEAGDRPRANLLGSMLGIDQGTLNAMFEGRKEFDAILKAQRENARMTKASTERAQRLAEAFKDVQFAAENAGLQLLETLNPALQKAAHWLVENKDNVIQLAEAFGAVLIGVMGITAAKFVAKSGPIGIISAGVFALWNDFDNFKKGNDHLIDWDKWSKETRAGIDSIKSEMMSFFKWFEDDTMFGEFAQGMGARLSEYFDAIAKGFDIGGEIWENIKKGIFPAIGEFEARYIARFGSMFPKLQQEAKDALSINNGSLITDTIGKAEGGYNSYNKGRAGDSNGVPLNLTDMTVGQIMALQLAHKTNQANGIFAAGKGQWIPSTFKSLVKSLGIDPNTKFDEKFQDALMMKTIPQKTMDYWAGKHNDVNGALHAMSGVWAGLPDPEKGGKSFYEGTGGNKANIGMEEAMRMMQYGRSHYSDIEKQMQGNEIIIHGGINVTVPPGSDGAAIGKSAYNTLTDLVRKGDGGGAK